MIGLMMFLLRNDSTGTQRAQFDILFILAFPEGRLLTGT